MLRVSSLHIALTNPLRSPCPEKPPRAPLHSARSKGPRLAVRRSGPEHTVRQSEARAPGWVRARLLAAQRKRWSCPANTPSPSSAERINQTVEILKHTVDIEEKGVKLKLTIVDTPGFGDAVNNSEW